MKKDITFKTEIQASLFRSELLGQISDGMWENATPFNHHQSWSGVQVHFGNGRSAGQKLGRNFDVVKCNYNFAAKDLVDNEIVQARMLAIGQGHHEVNGVAVKYDRRHLLSDLREIKKVVRIYRDDDTPEKIAEEKARDEALKKKWLEDDYRNQLQRGADWFIAAAKTLRRRAEEVERYGQSFAEAVAEEEDPPEDNTWRQAPEQYIGWAVNDLAQIAGSLRFDTAVTQAVAIVVTRGRLDK